MLTAMSVQSSFADALKALGVQLRSDGTIEHVFTGSVASKGHLMRGDKIVAVDNTPMADSAKIQSVMTSSTSSKLILTIERQGKRYRVGFTRSGGGPATAGAGNDEDEPSPAVVVADKLDKELVDFFRKSKDSDTAYSEVIASLQSLPGDLKSRMHGWGMKIVITPTILAALPELVNEKPHGYSHGGNYNNCPGLCRGNAIYVAERVSYGNGPPQLHRRLTPVLMHELGHAFDHHMSISTSEGFLKELASDKQHISSSQSDAFYYYAQEGAEAEMFAELFSVAHPGGRRGGADKEALALSKAFPRTYAYVQAHAK